MRQPATTTIPNTCIIEKGTLPSKHEGKKKKIKKKNLKQLDLLLLQVI